MSTPDPADTVDILLRKAGADWRATQPAVPEPDLTRLTEPGPDRRRSRRWLPAVAASVAIVAAGAVVFSSGDGTRLEPSAAKTTTQALRQLVRNGDLVEVTGTIFAAPGQPVVYCPNLPSTGESPATTCPARLAVTLTGVDLDRLTNPGTRNGVRFGDATVRGIWHDRTIDVREQTPPPAEPPVRPPVADTVPCAPPAGGWKQGNWGDAPLAAQPLFRYVDSRPDRFVGSGTAIVAGLPSTWTQAPTTVTEVITVSVLKGDLARARRDLEKLYKGNLCVYRGSRLFEPAELASANAAMDVLVADDSNAIYGFGHGTTTEPGEVELLVIDQRVYDAIERIGFEYFDLKPDIRPVL